METTPISTPDISTNEARVILWNKRRTIIICPRCSGIHEYAGTARNDYTNLPIYSAPSMCCSVYNSLSSHLASLGDPEGISTIYSPKYPTYYEVGKGYDSDPYPYFYSPSWLEEAKLRRDSIIQRQTAENTRSLENIGFRVRNPVGSHSSNIINTQAFGSSNNVALHTANQVSFHSMPHLIEGTSRSTQEMLNLDSDDPDLHLINMSSNGDDEDEKLVVRLEKNDRVIESWRVTVKGKTLAMLFRGRGLLPKCAEAGSGRRSHSERHPRCQTIPRNEFTRYGLNRSRMEGYSLPSHRHPERTPGEWHAGHAEMQLIHWFIKENLSVLEDSKHLLGYRELKEIQPIWSCPITILASTTPCDICNSYARHIESRYPVEIILRT